MARLLNQALWFFFTFFPDNPRCPSSTKSKFWSPRLRVAMVFGPSWSASLVISSTSTRSNPWAIANRLPRDCKKLFTEMSLSRNSAMCCSESRSLGVNKMTRGKGSFSPGRVSFCINGRVICQTNLNHWPLKPGGSLAGLAPGFGQRFGTGPKGSHFPGIPIPFKAVKAPGAHNFRGRLNSLGPKVGTGVLKFVASQQLSLLEESGFQTKGGFPPGFLPLEQKNGISQEVNIFPQPKRKARGPQGPTLG